MTKPPLILVSPDIEEEGAEFADKSISLSEAYLRALMDNGALPLTLPTTSSRELISEYVRRADGVLLTGGEDINPALYANGIAPRLRRTVAVTPDHGERDLFELILIDEIFRQRKPLLAICRGHQMLNVALGGTLIMDIPSQVPNAINHRRMDKRSSVAHEVRLTEGSLLSRITGRHTLGVNSTHHQAVAKVAEPLKTIAYSKDGVAEGMELKPEAARLSPFLLSLQFHPERLASCHAEHRAIFRAFAHACAQPSGKKL